MREDKLEKRLPVTGRLIRYPVGRRMTLKRLMKLDSCVRTLEEAYGQEIWCVWVNDDQQNVVFQWSVDARRAA